MKRSLNELPAGQVPVAYLVALTIFGIGTLGGNCNGSTGGGTAGGAGGNSTCVSQPHGVGQNGVLELFASKACYAAGEQIVLTVKLNNTGTAPCEVVLAPQGSITVASMTVNGNPVLPELGSAAYANGITDALLQVLGTVPAGGSSSFPWENNVRGGFAYTLGTQTVKQGGGADTAHWSVKQPGAYQMTVNYAPPPLAYGTPPDMCRFVDTASIGFTVN